MCQKTKILLYAQGKKKEMSIKNKGLSPPAALHPRIHKVDNSSYAELYSIRTAGRVGASGRQQVWSKAEQMEGENKKAHHQT